MSNFDVLNGPTLADLSPAPYLLQIPVYAASRDEAAIVLAAAVSRAHALAPEHLDAAKATIVDRKDREECLLICARTHWSGKRCPAPYGHAGPCPDMT